MLKEMLNLSNQEEYNPVLPTLVPFKFPKNKSYYRLWYEGAEDWKTLEGKTIQNVLKWLHRSSVITDMYQPVTPAHSLMPQASLLQSAFWPCFTDAALPLFLPKHGYKYWDVTESPNTVDWKLSLYILLYVNTYYMEEHSLEESIMQGISA